jgi:hypothetical protein
MVSLSLDFLDSDQQETRWVGRVANERFWSQTNYIKKERKDLVSVFIEVSKIRIFYFSLTDILQILKTSAHLQKVLIFCYLS